jgi:hypothetical protein
MNRLIFYFAVLATGLCMQVANAQTTNDSVKKPKVDRYSDAEIAKREKENSLKQLHDEKDNIAVNEKALLKSELERINKLVTDGKLAPDEAQKQKEQAAKTAALNIDNKTAIIDNQIALAERDQNYTFKPNNGSELRFGIGNAYDDNGSVLIGYDFKSGRTKPRYDKRTYSDVVVAYGFNNTVTTGLAFKDSPYKWMKSGYGELGYTVRWRVLKNSNALRLAYGISWQFNNLTLSGDRYFVDHNGQTTAEPFPHKLKDQNLTIANLVAPVYLEFGKSKKVEYADHFRYEIDDYLKAGIGGYIGMKTNVWQDLKYNANNSKNTDRFYQDYNASNFVYGVAAYVGNGPLSLYLRYDLNPVFKNAVAKQHMVSLSLRFDL